MDGAAGDVIVENGVHHLVTFDGAFAFKAIADDNGFEFAAIAGDIGFRVGYAFLDLVAEKVDLALRFEPPSHTSFVAKRLIADPWVVCASPAYIEQFGEPARPNDLKQHRCLTIEAKMQETNHFYNI